MHQFRRRGKNENVLSHVVMFSDVVAVELFPNFSKNMSRMGLGIFVKIFLRFKVKLKLRSVISDTPGLGMCVQLLCCHGTGAATPGSGYPASTVHRLRPDTWSPPPTPPSPLLISPPHYIRSSPPSPLPPHCDPSSYIIDTVTVTQLCISVSNMLRLGPHCTDCTVLFWNVL